jgi:hypothetical protein
MTVGALLSTVSSSELTEWIAFYGLKPDESKADPLKELSKMFSGRIKRAK